MVSLLKLILEIKCEIRAIWSVCSIEYVRFQSNSITDFARRLSLAILLFAVGVSVDAAEVRYSEFQAKRQEEVFVLSLDEAIALGARENRLIRAAYLQRISQKFDLYVSEGKFFPKLLLTTTALSGRVSSVSTYSKNILTSANFSLPTGASLSLSTSNDQGGGVLSSSTSITLMQPLLKNGGLDVNTASVRIARLDEAVNRLTLKANLSQTVVQVIYAYRELVRAQEQKMIADAALRRSRNLYEVNRALISTGRMAEVEIFQTEAEVANREVALEEANNQIDSSRLALVALLALEPRTPLAAVAPKEVEWKGSDPLQALETALSFQTDYQIAKLQQERARVNLDFAKNQQLWDLSLVAGRTQNRGSSTGIGSNNSPTTNSRTDSSFAGVQLTIPLGDRSIKQAEVRASVEQQTQDLRTMETRQIVEQYVRGAVRNVETRWRQFELSKRARELTLLKLNAEKDKLQVGRSSNFQVLSFENDLRAAENAELNAQIAYLNALTDLDERTGKTLDVWNIPILELEKYEN